jgi:hypothetical protein
MVSYSNPIPVPGLDQIANIRLNISGTTQFWTYDLFRPSAQPAAAGAPAAPVSLAPPIPDASLAGQAWGWPIPITAGNRPGLPGRRVRARLTKQPDGHSVLDALISFGWRAEVMAGFDPADFDATKMLANGVDIWLKDVFTFPGGSVTIYDGLQTAAVWADIDGDNAQAYIFHILADVRGLPLAQFKDQIPDSWSLHCEDVAGSSSFTGIRPQFGAAHHTTISLSTTSTADDTATNSGQGTALSLDRIPPGKNVWKVRTVTAGTDSRQGVSTELLAGDSNLANSPGFGTVGIVLRRDGSLYDGFPRPGPGFAWGSGSYTLHAYNSTTGGWWVGETDATGSSPTWYGDPAAGTAAAGIISFAENPHAALFGTGGEMFEFVQPVASEIPVGFTAYSPDPSGITLAKWFQLAAGLAEDLKGKLTIAPEINDVLDSFFFVDSQSTFNRDAMAMCGATGCFLREDNAGVHIGRGVNGTTYSVDLAVPAARLLRTSGESALVLTRSSEQDLPAEVRVQAISSEKADKFTEQKARWERGPKPTSVSTRSESYRVQAGMTVNLMQTYASRTLDRMTESRDKAHYKLPWQDAIAVQPGNIHTVPEDDLLYTVMVTQASREANRVVAIEAVRLHVAQDYQGTADVGTGFANPVALPTVNGVITGSITPVGSLHGVFLAEDDGIIVGTMSPVGSLNATFSLPSATGTITGSMSPTGSLTGTVGSGAPTTISARYWSINISAKVGAEAGVSELEFAQLGGTKIAGGTASATSTTGGFPASNAIDGSTSTAWVAGSGSLPQRLSVDFGSAVDVNVVRVKGRSSSVYPTTFTVDYSSDGSTWTTAWTVTGADDSTYTDTPLPYPNPTATGGLKPLWRINVTATESGTLAVNEVEMRGSVSGADLTGSGRPWCQTVGFSLPVTNAFDNNTTTTYHAAGASGVIGYEFTDSVSVVELYIYPRSGTPAQAPKDFTLQYSADGVTWTTALSPAAQTGWTAAVPRTFS